MVAAGVYVVARLFPLFRPAPAALAVLAVIAAITMLLGALRGQCAAGHQTGTGLVHGQPDRVHDRGAGRRRARPRRCSTCSPMPRSRRCCSSPPGAVIHAVGHQHDGRDGRPAPRHAGHVLGHDGRAGRARRVAAVRRVLEQGRDHRRGLGASRAGRPWLVWLSALVTVAAHRVVRRAAVAAYLLRRAARPVRGASARGAVGDADAAGRAGRPGRAARIRRTVRRVRPAARFRRPRGAGRGPARAVAAGRTRGRCGLAGLAARQRRRPRPGARTGPAGFRGRVLPRRRPVGAWSSGRCRRWRGRSAGPTRPW